jgi:hypothetical protein
MPAFMRLTQTAVGATEAVTVNARIPGIPALIATRAPAAPRHEKPGRIERQLLDPGLYFQ